jgi:4-amino-4-deoxy-L-arabinose transferase-like glycosyltransferase
MIIIIASLLFVPFLGQVHLFDWDEINFAEAAREMLVTKNWLTVQIDYQPFWEKPPLFIWMQALSMKLFGVNEFAARFPNAVCGVVTLLVLFRIGRKLVNQQFGLLWVMVYAGSILPFFYFKSGIIDPWFNLFIFTGIYYAFCFNLEQSDNWKKFYIAASAFFIGLGILTKGPVALLVFGLCYAVFVFIKLFKVKVTWAHIFIFGITLFITGGFWFLLQIFTGHFDTVRDFFVYQVRLFTTKDAGHGGFLLYHFVVLFFGVFPASVFALRSFRHNKHSDKENLHEFKNWMIILFWTVLILFTIVKTKIVHYSSLCYFPLTFLAAYVIFRYQERRGSLPKWIKITLMVLVMFWGLVLVGLQLFVMNKDKIVAMGWIHDQFAVGNLQANVAWTGYEYLIGVVYIAIITLVFLFKRVSLQSQIIAMLLTTTLFSYATVVIITPRIEGYSQNAAIEFYIGKQKENCYIIPVNFKSYAHLYYSMKPVPTNSQSYDRDWLLKGKIDKPAYFVLKNVGSDEFERNNPNVLPLYERNGFVFYKRLPENLK